MDKKGITKHLDFLILDVVTITISFVIAYLIHIGTINQLLNSSSYITLYFTIILISFCVSYFINPYSGILKRNWVLELKELLTYIVYTILFLSLYLLVSKTGAVFSRITISLIFIIYLPLALIVRTLWKKLIKRTSKRALTSDTNKKLLVITTAKEVDKAVKKLLQFNYDSYSIDSICVIDKDLKGNKIDIFSVKTNKNDILSYLCHNWVDEVLIATDSKKVPKEIFLGLAQAGITTSVVTSKIEGFENRKQIVNDRFGYTVISTSIADRTTKQIFLKRLMDIVGGLVGCLITFILALIIGPMIYKKSPGPIFFKQERIGQNGRRFKMYKFRSMIMNADDLKDELRSKNRIKDGMMFKIENDPRIIPGIGEFIRKTSLDEFPQFINVLKGDMSLVGTRPPTVDEWIKYKLEHRIRMSIKPGITGLWQTNGRSKITDFNKVIEYDTKYINEWSLSLDIEILFKTVLVLFSKRDKDEAM